MRFMIALLVFASVSMAETIGTDTDSGWFSSSGDNASAAGITWTGRSRGEYSRTYARFDLSSLSGPVTSGVLRFRNLGYVSSDASEAVTLYSYEAAPSTLTSTPQGSGVPVFNDLGNGMAYGTTVVTPASSYAFIDVTLTAAAISAINSTSGLFAIGFRVDSPDDNLGSSRSEGFYLGQNTTLRLGIDGGPIPGPIPEPGTYALFGLALLGYGVWRRRATRRRAAA